MLGIRLLMLLMRVRQPIADLIARLMTEVHLSLGRDIEERYCSSHTRSGSASVLGKEAKMFIFFLHVGSLEHATNRRLTRGPTFLACSTVSVCVCVSGQRCDRQRHRGQSGGGPGGLSTSGGRRSLPGCDLGARQSRPRRAPPFQ